MKECTKNQENSPLGIKILLVYNGINDNTAAARAVRGLKCGLEAQDVSVIVSESEEDAKAVLVSDPTVQCILLKLNNQDDKDYLKSSIYCMFCANITVMCRYFCLPVVLPPQKCPRKFSRMSATLFGYWKIHRILSPDGYWQRWSVTGSLFCRRCLRRWQSFPKCTNIRGIRRGIPEEPVFSVLPAAGFFNFFREPVFRSDLSISVGELGSLLDHSGPIGESEKYAAKVFGADRTYHVTNGSSTSNRVILMASVTRNQIALCDRNCHKSVEHAITMSGAIPVYMVPTRNRYGIIGPITPDRLEPEAVKESIAENPLVKDGIDTKPVHAIITNSTYDGLCYNVNRVKELLGKSVDRLHFDEAWYGYARFNPMYKGRFAMCCDPKDDDRKGPTMFATQSTHKLLAAFSQASMIHVRDGRNPIDHQRFNEAFMMHASTSPFYPIIASNDISAAMMDGPGGKTLTDASIREAVSFRKTMARLYAEFTAAGKDWFSMSGSRILSKMQKAEKKFRCMRRPRNSWPRIPDAGCLIPMKNGMVSAT